ncbi:MAG: hypothetical protein WD579_01045 [Candidatus Paceibacterota bacterium]
MRNLITLFTIATLVILSALPAEAQTNWQIDAQVLFRDGARESLTGVFTTHSITESSVIAWSYLGVSPSWGEALGGPAFASASANSYFEVGVGAGVEQPTFTPRFGAYALYVRGPADVFLFLEWGDATGSWYYLTSHYAVGRNISLGVHAQRYVGVGPRVRYGIGPAYIAGTYTYDHEVEMWAPGVSTGIRF